MTKSKAKSKTKKINTLYSDGGCKGNPGPMRIAIYDCQYKENNLIKEVGVGTCNIAEYLGIRQAINIVRHKYKNTDKIIIYTDSRLVEGHLNRNWKIKTNVELVTEVKDLYNQFENIRVNWVNREKNLAGHMLE